MTQRVGTCSRCGGDVMGVRGAWFSVNPPPPDKCSGCGGVARQDVIQIGPPPSHRPPQHPGYLTATDVEIR